MKKENMNAKRKNENEIKSINLIFDYNHILFPFLFSKRWKELLELREELTRKIISSFLSNYQPFREFSYPEGVEIIKDLQEKIEREISRIVSSKSIYYWFHLYRRIAPGSNFPGESPSGISLYRRMMECAFLKYGKFKPGKELLFSDGTTNVDQVASGNYKKALEALKLECSVLPKGVYLGEFGFSNMVELCQVERLVYEYLYTTQLVRRLYKGGKLFIVNDEYFVENEKEAEELIQSFDNRNLEAQNLTTNTGIPIDIDPTKMNFPVLLPVYNCQQMQIHNLPFDKVFNINLHFGKDFVPNFLWGPFIDFDHYYVQNQFLEDQFYEELGFTLAALVITFCSICFRAIANVWVIDNPQYKIGMTLNLIQRAYGYFQSKFYLADDILFWRKNINLPSLQNYSLKKDEVLKILDYFTLREDRRKSISLTTRGPRPLIFPTGGEEFVLDYASILEILIGITHSIREIEAKGHLFEEWLNKRLEDKGFNVWVRSKRLIGTDNSSREIDCSFCHKDALFILEQKCINRSYGFEIGDIKAVNFRKEKLNDAIMEIDDKADWLLKHPVGNNYEIPPNIKYVVPVVVSPFVEYLWSKDDYYWLTMSIPRICTPSEVEKLRDDKIFNHIIKRPFVRIIR